MGFSRPGLCSLSSRTFLTSVLLTLPASSAPILVFGLLLSWTLSALTSVSQPCCLTPWPPLSGPELSGQLGRSSTPSVYVRVPFLRPAVGFRVGARKMPDRALASQGAGERKLGEVHPYNDKAWQWGTIVPWPPACCPVGPAWTPLPPPSHSV